MQLNELGVNQKYRQIDKYSGLLVYPQHQHRKCKYENRPNS